MARYLKITLGIISALILLLIVAAVIAIATFDPNKYKTEIADAAHRATGRELSIQGDLHLSLFPWLGVQTGAMTLSNAPGFGAEPFAKIHSAAIKVKLLPLLKRNVEVDVVTLDGVTVRLMRDASGRDNWSDLAGGPSAAPPTKPATKPNGTASTAPSTTALSSLAIGGVRINNATLIWDDQQNKARYELSKLSLHTGPIIPGQSLTLNLETDISSSAPALSAHLKLTTQASYDVATQHLSLKALQLSAQAQPQGLAIENAQLSLSSDVALDLAAQRLQLNALKLSAKAHTKGLPVEDTQIALNADAALDLAAQRYDITALKLSAQAQGAALPGKKINAELAANIKADLKQQIADVTDLNISAWNLNVRGDINGRDLLNTPQFTGTLTIANFSPRELFKQLNLNTPTTADPKVLNNADADLSFSVSPTKVELGKLKLTLDQTHLNGSAAIDSFAKPAYRFQLNIDDIDADRYLPPPVEAKLRPVTPAAAGAAAVELPTDMLRALNVDGSIALGHLKVAKLTVSELKATLKAKGGVIHAAPLAAKLYGGSYRGDLRLDVSGKTPQLAMNETLSGINIGPLTHDVLAKDLVAGTGDVHMQLTASGVDPDSITRTLNGELGFNFVNGRVNGVNLIELIKKDYLKYLQDLSVGADKLNQTVFSKFSATAKVRNGELNTQDMVLDSAQLNIKGKGTVNLANQSLNLRLDALPEGELAKQLKQFKDTAIPIRVEGSFTTPRFATDLDAVLKAKFKARLEQEKRKREAELKKQAEEEKAKLRQQLREKQEQAKQQEQEKQKELEKKVQEQLKDKLKGLFK